jgi:hypothetical protein
MTLSHGSSQPRGSLAQRVLHGAPRIAPASFEAVVRYGLPQRGLSAEVNAWRRRNLANLWRCVSSRTLACSSSSTPCRT